MLSKIFYCSIIPLLTLNAVTLKAQELTQAVKGVIIDKVSEKTLEGATVTLAGAGSYTASSAEGKFVLKNVPVGRQKIIITYNGYKSVIIPEVLVTSGKEVLLYISMEQSISELGRDHRKICENKEPLLSTNM